MREIYLDIILNVNRFSVFLQRKFLDTVCSFGDIGPSIVPQFTHAMTKQVEVIFSSTFLSALNEIYKFALSLRKEAVSLSIG